MIKMTKKNEVKLSAQKLENLGKTLLNLARYTNLIKCSIYILAPTVREARNKGDLTDCKLTLDSVYDFLDTVYEPTQDMAKDLDTMAYALMNSTDSDVLKDLDLLQ